MTAFFTSDGETHSRYKRRMERFRERYHQFRAENPHMSEETAKMVFLTRNRADRDHAEEAISRTPS